MLDVTSQCHPEVAGIIANAPSLRRDVDALLRTYRVVRPDARRSFGILHTTVHHNWKWPRPICFKPAVLLGKPTPCGCDREPPKRLVWLQCG
jgi:hypothetical protein